jgi:ribosomal protein S3
MRMFRKTFIIDVIIERKDPEHCKVIIKTPRPGIIIGRDGQRLKKLQEKVDKKIIIVFDEFKIT